MDLNRHIIDFIRERSERCGWESNADLARHIGLTEATWSRIMRLKQKTIKDNVANLICTAFNITPVELLLISEGQKDFTAKEKSTAYRINSTRRHLPPELARLLHWLETEACPDQIAAVLATARAVGLPNGSTISSHSGKEASRSAAKAS
jgi:DNA-binding Xre family transcriptional regulator